MSLNPEENLLDESLREAFRDYHLPPAEHMHVWAGVETRIAELPAARASLPFRLVLPLTAALGIGVAVGWLLPRPAAPPPPPRALPAVHTATWAAAPLPAALPETVASPAVAMVRPAGGTAPVAGRRVSGPAAERAARPHARPAAPPVAQPTPEPAPVALVAEAAPPAPAPAQPETSTASAAAARDSNATLPAATGPTGAPAVAPGSPQGLAAAPEHPSAPSAKPTRPDRVNEKMLYHKPTHRQPERGIGGFRRWVSRLTQGIRHLL